MNANNWLAQDPVLGEYARRVRAVQGKLSAYRLGLEVGFAGLHVANPYGEHTRRGMRYTLGWQAGIAARDAKHQRDISRRGGEPGGVSP